MRSQGVRHFPDPTSDDQGIGFDLAGLGINPSSPPYKAADEACAAPGTPPPKSR
jgi:hypothetical protein